MKLITAVLKPTALETVFEALRAANVEGVTITEVVGSGRQGGHTEVYRGAEYRMDTVDKIKIEIVTTDLREAEVIDVIVQAANTGQVGDGKVWSTDVSQVVRVRTGESGPAAL